MRAIKAVVGFAIILSLTLVIPSSHSFVSAVTSGQIAFGVNLAQMRPPIDDYAFDFNTGVPPQYGVNWLREAAFVDPVHAANFTKLYNQYSAYGYNWELRLDILAVTDLYGTNWTLPDWDSYVTKVVNDFPNVHVWEVGNEVLSGEEQYNTGYLASGNLSLAYFNILKDAYQIIKQHDPSDTVIAFGGQDIFVPGDLALYNSGSFQDDSYELAAQVWANGGANYCDAVSLHIYGDNTGGAWLPNETVTYNGVTSKVTLQQIWNGYINEYEQLTGKPIWFTETGEPIDSPPNDPTPPVIGNSLQKQAAFLTQTFTFLSSFSFTRAIFWFKLVGLSQYYNGNGDLVYTLDDGLFNQDGTARPATSAFQSFSQAVAVPSPTPTELSSPSPSATSTTSTVPTSTPSPTLSHSISPTSSRLPTSTVPEFPNSVLLVTLLVSSTLLFFFKRTVKVKRGVSLDH
jgi:hypothetical protein